MEITRELIIDKLLMSYCYSAFDNPADTMREVIDELVDPDGKYTMPEEGMEWDDIIKVIENTYFWMEENKLFPDFEDTIKCLATGIGHTYGTAANVNLKQFGEGKKEEFPAIKAFAKAYAQEVQPTTMYTAKFIEWIGTHYHKMHGGWMHQYADQRQRDNLLQLDQLMTQYIKYHDIESKLVQKNKEES